ncbi:uncharacterized protein EV154DRAFT_415211 [Mucor mucedo]|uniref:uncharacterized protein n=1 Tax=Mucor mucedo TaxID=29922 RepID=UPI0022205F12|nr:uncharacterized protein EV154DRAFT_415211 [Mucor mucedo]KAI7894492.1 hypothetical protein EV154DRAFT_415211 [Mucor mucedo]
MNGTKKIVFAITANALAVLIVTLVNFILFIKGKNEFTVWCIEQSKDTIEKIYTADHKNTTSFPVDRLNGSTDIYNCERLFQDEVKWGLICLIVMFVVYIHWILIIAAREALDFYRQRGLMPAMTEFSNIAPSKTSKNYNVFHSIKPSTNILQDLLTHKQYGQFIPEEQLIHDRSSNITISVEPEKLVDEHVNSTVIHFEDNIYNSKEIQSPCNVLHK